MDVLVYKYVRLSYLHLYMRDKKKKDVVSLACFLVFTTLAANKMGDDTHIARSYMRH